MKPNKVEFIRSAFGPKDFVRDDLPQVAFAGRSNVGKSSLLNALVGHKGVAKTSSSPGRTRCVNYFLVNGTTYFVDLPGYGYAKRARAERAAWGRVVEQYLREASDRLLMVLLVDAKIEGSPLDTQAAEYFAEFGIQPLIAATKIDRVSRNRRSRCLANIAKLLCLSDTGRLLPVSSQTGEGMQELWKRLSSD